MAETEFLNTVALEDREDASISLPKKTQPYKTSLGSKIRFSQSVLTME